MAFENARKHDFSKRPDPEREMIVDLTVRIPVFGRTRQVQQTKLELLRYAQLHLSPEAEIVGSAVREKPKPLPGVAVNLDAPLGNPPVRGNGMHPSDIQ